MIAVFAEQQTRFIAGPPRYANQSMPYESTPGESLPIVHDILSVYTLEAKIIGLGQLLLGWIG